MDKIGAWALTEPGAGSDAFGSMKTRARKVDGGWRLSGSKTFITNAPFADIFVVYARMPDDAGRPRLHRRARARRGSRRAQPFKKMGMHASPTGEVFLDDVFVPADQLVGGDETENARAGGEVVAQGRALRDDADVPRASSIAASTRACATRRSARSGANRSRRYQLVQEKIAQDVHGPQHRPGAADAAARGGPRGRAAQRRGGERVEALLRAGRRPRSRWRRCS